jgi:magnesium-transporting ATPase (P-type)
MRLFEGSSEELTEGHKQNVIAKMDELADEGLRVLALSGRSGMVFTLG